MANDVSLIDINGPVIPDPDFLATDREARLMLVNGIRVDPTKIPALDAVTVTLTANAAQNATSLAVAALSGMVPAGRLLDFGTNKVARTSAAAAPGATTLAVDAIPTALVTGDSAIYRGSGLHPHIVRGGSVWGRVRPARGVTPTNVFFVPFVPGTHDEWHMIARDTNVVKSRGWLAPLIKSTELQIRTDYLPPESQVPAVLAVIRGAYTCITSQAPKAN